MKTLIIYYSYSGNTEKIADYIKEKLNCDEFELKPKEAYTTNYDKLVDDTNTEEYHRKELLEKPNIKDYERLIILTPTWWYKMAEPIYTYLSETNLNGKIVCPIMTNAGWPGTVIKDMTYYAKKSGADVKDSLELKFSSNNFLDKEKLDKWLENKD